VKRRQSNHIVFSIKLIHRRCGVFLNQKNMLHGYHDINGDHMLLWMFFWRWQIEYKWLFGVYEVTYLRHRSLRDWKASQKQLTNQISVYRRHWTPILVQVLHQQYFPFSSPTSHYHKISLFENSFSKKLDSNQAKSTSYRPRVSLLPSSTTPTAASNMGLLDPLWTAVDTTIAGMYLYPLCKRKTGRERCFESRHPSTPSPCWSFTQKELH